LIFYKKKKKKKKKKAILLKRGGQGMGYRPLPITALLNKKEEWLRDHFDLVKMNIQPFITFFSGYTAISNQDRSSHAAIFFFQ